MTERLAHQNTAMAIIVSGADLRQREGQFLGGIAFTSDRISDKQQNWLDLLAERHLKGGEK